MKRSQRRDTMRRHLTSVAAIALALGMTAAGAQNVDQRDPDQGKQTDQVERNQQPQTSGQSRNMPSQQRSDQQAPQQNPPSTTGQNAADRQQGDRQPERGPNRQQQ